jgi:hypothetical protein
MPDENPTRDVAAELDAVERDVLYLMIDSDYMQPIWSVDDLGRAINRPAVDAVRELRGAGLIHQTTDGFVFATRAAWRMVEIVGQVI